MEYKNHIISWNKWTNGKNKRSFCFDERIIGTECFQGVFTNKALFNSRYYVNIHTFIRLVIKAGTLIPALITNLPIEGR